MDYPVKKGQQIELQILRSGDAGCGVAAVEGLTVLVDQTLPGERVLDEITEVRPRFARARAVRVLVPVGKCNTLIAGATQGNLASYIRDAAETVAEICAGAAVRAE